MALARLRVIVLTSGFDGTQRANIKLALWADVPAARQKFYANDTNKSQWIDALPGDIVSLVNGSVVERVVIYNPDQTKTTPQMEADVAAIWTAYQAEINAKNTWPIYGTNLDNTGAWTIVQVS